MQVYKWGKQSIHVSAGDGDPQYSERRGKGNCEMQLPLLMQNTSLHLTAPAGGRPGQSAGVSLFHTKWAFTLDILSFPWVFQVTLRQLSALWSSSQQLIHSYKKSNFSSYSPWKCTGCPEPSAPCPSLGMTPVTVSCLQSTKQQLRPKLTQQFLDSWMPSPFHLVITHLQGFL